MGVIPDSNKMKTTFALLASIVVLLCAFSVLRTEAAVDGATASFTNQTFSENGTNLIGTFEFNKNFAADSLQCNFTFKTDIRSDTETVLSAGLVHLYNNDTITNGTSIVYYLYPHGQQKNFGSQFDLGVSCQLDGDVLVKQTLASVVINNPKGGSSSAATITSFLLPLLTFLLY